MGSIIEGHFFIKAILKQSCISSRLLHTYILAAIAYDTQGIVGYDTGSFTGVALATGTDEKLDCQSNRIYRKIFCSFAKVRCSDTFFNTPMLMSRHTTQVTNKCHLNSKNATERIFSENYTSMLISWFDGKYITK